MIVVAVVAAVITNFFDQTTTFTVPNGITKIVATLQSGGGNGAG
jgi:hypothetical protein